MFHGRHGSKPWASDVVYGLDMEAALERFRQVDRDLDVVEGFCGVGAVYRNALRRRFSAAGFDKHRVPGRTDSALALSSEDLASEAGFMNALSLVARLRRGGLLWLAPVCASWVWMNLLRTMRCAANSYYGDESYGPVRLGNELATNAAFLIEFAMARGVECVVENPPWSFIWKFPPMAAVMSKGLQHSAVTYRCAFERKASSVPRLWKVYKFWATGSWIQGTRRTCQCAGKPHLRMTKSYLDRLGKRRHNGIPNLLTQSAAYPDALGVSIVRAWSKGAARVPSAGSVRKSCKRKVQRPGPQVLPKRARGSPAWLRPPVSSVRLHSLISADGSSVRSPASGPRRQKPLARGPCTGAPSWLRPPAEDSAHDPEWQGGRPGMARSSVPSWARPPAEDADEPGANCPNWMTPAP